MKLHKIHIIKLWEGFWVIIWNFLEWSGLGKYAGKTAPWIFSQMTGCRGKKIKEVEDE